LIITNKIIFKKQIINGTGWAKINRTVFDIFISDELEMWLVCHFVEKIVQKETGYKLDSNFGDVVKYSLQMMQRHF